MAPPRTAEEKRLRAEARVAARFLADQRRLSARDILAVCNPALVGKSMIYRLVREAGDQRPRSPCLVTQAQAQAAEDEISGLRQRIAEIEIENASLRWRLAEIEIENASLRWRLAEIDLANNSQASRGG